MVAVAIWGRQNSVVKSVGLTDNLELNLASCVTLAKLLNLSEP